MAITKINQSGATTGKYGTYQYGAMNSYDSPYEQQIADTLNQIQNHTADKFSYNYVDDPMYQQYADTYTRNGNRAMKDTLGQVSARTGGLASSYAGSAAQQTYNQYMQALNDKIPELYNLAYSRYRDQTSDLYNLADLYASRDKEYYNMWADELGQYNSLYDNLYVPKGGSGSRDKADNTTAENMEKADVLQYVMDSVRANANTSELKSALQQAGYSEREAQSMITTAGKARQLERARQVEAHPTVSQAELNKTLSNVNKTVWDMGIYKK